MSEGQVSLLVVGGSAVVAVLLIVVLARKSSAFSERLLRLATSFGWEAPQRVWWSGAIRGRWRGIAVELRHMNRYKGVPERILLTMSTFSPARVIIKHRGGFMSKPLTLFGPPIVEPMNLRDREKYWVRSNELVFVERLFSRSEVDPALEPNLIARFDVVDLGPKRLRVLRAIDHSAVKKRFNRPFIKFTRDYELIETIAAEEWKLAAVIVETLGLRGYEN
ncbi:MAG: hypothetical protein JO093_01615 [Acidobacteria bacterium]|nr:hypothetical protein [Acidobacteriota bacterium]MBV9184281.1 hypothetical protein [Acidobacteriota bacterium]